MIRGLLVILNLWVMTPICVTTTMMTPMTTLNMSRRKLLLTAKLGSARSTYALTGAHQPHGRTVR